MGIIKTITISVLVVISMQINVQGKSIEEHILDWAHSKGSVNFVNGVAQGGIKIINDVTRQITKTYQDLTQSPKEQQKASF